jgi:hypothetical protein
MVRTPNERVSTESGDSGRLRCGANIGARQHAGKSICIGEDTPNDCRTRRKANIDVNDGHRPRVGFGRAIIGLEVAVNIALRPFSKVSSGTSGSLDKSPLVWQSSHSKPQRPTLSDERDAVLLLSV